MILERQFALKPVRILFESGSQYIGPMLNNLLVRTVMDLFRRHQGNTGMTMLFIIPVEKILTKYSRILNRAEPLRELRTILQCFELGFRVRVVIADMRAAVGLVTPRSLRRCATTFDFILDPRSA